MNLRNFNALQFSRWLMGFGVFGVSLPARAADHGTEDAPTATGASSPPACCTSAAE